MVDDADSSAMRLREPIVVFLLALAPRLLHLSQLIRHDPFFEIPAVDGQHYHAWASALATGDFEAEGVLILGPLYPYLMAGVYALAGPSLLVLKSMQALLGAFSCALVFDLGRQLQGRTAAWIAALGMAYSEMLIFYGGTVMVANVQVPLILGVLLTHLAALRRPTPMRFALVGALVGASVLARQTMLLFVLFYAPFVLWMLWPAHAGRYAARCAGAFCLVVALMIAPFTVRNYVVSGDLVMLNSTGGANLFMGNRRGATGLWSPPDLGRRRVDSPSAMREAFTAVAEEEAGRALPASEVSAYRARRALAEIAADPMGWLRLELRKLALFWNALEPWNNRAIEISRDFSWVLRAPLLGWGVVSPFALLGLGLWLHRLREMGPEARRQAIAMHGPALAVVAVYLAAALAFFVLSRYRVPAVPVLATYAAAVPVALWRWLRAGRLIALGLALTAAAVLVLATRPAPFFADRPLASMDYTMAHYNVANKYAELERLDEAIASYSRALTLSPHHIFSHNNLALCLQRAGRLDEAHDRWAYVLAWSEEHGDRRRAERARRRMREIESMREDEAPAADEEN